MFEYLLYRLGELLVSFLPKKLSYTLAVLFSDLRALIARADCFYVTANLKVIFPEKSDSEIRQIRRRMFRNFAKYLTEFFGQSSLSRDYIDKKVRLEDIKYLDRALSKGRGVIMLTAHIGNWELGGAVLGRLGYRPFCVALPHKNKAIDNFFNSRREKNGMGVIPLGKAFRQCYRYFKENKIVALVGDRDFTSKGMVIEFLGKPTILPEGPAALALMTGAEILPTFVIRNPDDSFILKFEPPLDIVSAAEVSRKNLSEDRIKQVIMGYKTVLEDYIRKYPDQWYMFRRFWV